MPPHPGTRKEEGKQQHRSIFGSFHERRVSSTGRGGGGSGFENKPGEARSPGDSARGLEASLGSAPALGAPEAETPLRGGRARPPFLDRQVTPPLLTRGNVQPSAPSSPEIPQHRSQPPAAGDPDPDPTAMAPSPGRSGGHTPGHQL